MLLLFVGPVRSLSQWAEVAREAGNEVVTALTVEQATENVARRRPSVVLIEASLCLPASLAIHALPNDRENSLCPILIGALAEGLDPAVDLGVLFDAGLDDVEIGPWSRPLLQAKMRAWAARIERENRMLTVSQENEARFRRLADGGFEGIVIHDKARIVEANAQLAQMYGYPLDEFVRMSAFSLVAPEWHDKLRSVIAEGGEQHYSIEVIRKDGTRFLVEVASRPFPHKGQMLRISSVRDISAQRDAEMKLRNSEQRLLATLNSIGEAVISTDIDERITQMNPIAEALMGVAAADVEGKSLAQVLCIVDKHTRKPLESLATRILRDGASGGVFSREVLLARGDHTTPIAESVAPIRGGDGRVLGVVLVFRNISVEREAERVLAERESTLRAFYDTAPFMMSVVELRGGHVTLASFNKQVVSALGLPANRSTPPGPQDLSADIAALWLAQSREALRRNDSVRFEYRHGEAEQRRSYFATISPIAQPPGEPPRLCIVCEDVTERRKLEARLQLSDRLATVGTLAAGVAHEINNPLTYVLGNLELVLRECDSPQPQLSRVRLAMELAHDGAERVRRIVRDLKLFSRIDSQQVGRVSLREITESAIQMSWNEIRHRAQLVRVFDATPEIEGNAAQLSQVVLNLLVNAAQSIPEGHADDNKISLHLFTGSGGDAVIEVSDTGAGIPPEELPRVFDPFFTTKPFGEGTGLGLSICHGIVTSLGGTIGVLSEPGHGATFRVSLPAASSLPPQRDVDIPRPVYTVRGRILIVDDEPLVGEALAAVLSVEHEVTIVDSAKRALALIEKGQPFDVILCDLLMPQMTGMALFDTLSRRFPEMAARMVFLTGGAFTEAARLFLQRVSAPRLDKPVDFVALRSMVQSILKGNGA